MHHHCKTCSIIFNSASKLVDHFVKTHKVNAYTKFACGIGDCGQRFSEIGRYQKHVKDFHSPLHAAVVEQNHSTANQFRCPILGCDKVCLTASSLRSHKFRHHRLATDVPTESRQSDTGDASDALECDFSVNNGSSVESSETLLKENCESLPTWSEDELKKKFIELYLILNAKHHVSQRILQTIVEAYRLLITESNNLVAAEICKQLARVGVPSNILWDKVIKDIFSGSVAEFVHSSEGPLRSAFIREKNFKSFFPYVSPTGHVLGPDNVNIRRMFHTVPLHKSLKSLLSNESLLTQLRENNMSASSDGYLRDIYDGTLFRKERLLCDSATIFLLLYSDDLELCNPIGCAKTVHKITNIYVSVANLQPWSRMKPLCLPLALCCREKDVAFFGLKKVLEPLITELKSLATNGIEIAGKMWKVRVLSILGDSLGTHTLTGFIESFGRTHYFCRFCEESRSEWRLRWYGNGDEEMDCYGEADQDEDEGEDDDDDDDSDDDVGDINGEAAFDCSSVVQDPFLVERSDEMLAVINEMCNEDICLPAVPMIASLRTEESYDDCVRKLNNVDHVKGIVGYCEFNDLDYFHCVSRLPPCLAHDIFEGLLSEDLSLVLQHLCSMYDITLSFINYRIKSCPLKGVDSLDRPPKVSGSKFKISGNAIQNWVLLRFFPLIIGDKVTDKNDEVWRMVLLLRRIVQMVCSPVISKKSLRKLKKMKRMYLHLRSTLFSKDLIPKDHFFEHYDVLIEIFGPLMRNCTLGFESKHTFFKDTIRGKRTTKNITKTLSKEHQLLMSSLDATNLVENLPEYDNCSNFQEGIISPDLYAFILSYFGAPVANTLALSEKVKFRGTLYSKGLVIVLSSETHSHLELCLIDTLCIQGKECYAAGYMCQAVIVPGLEVHRVFRTGTHTVVSLASLLDFAPYPIYTYSGREVIVIKHIVLPA